MHLNISLWLSYIIWHDYLEFFSKNSTILFITLRCLVTFTFPFSSTPTMSSRPINLFSLKASTIFSYVIFAAVIFFLVAYVVHSFKISSWFGNAEPFDTFAFFLIAALFRITAFFQLLLCFQLQPKLHWLRRSIQSEGGYTILDPKMRWVWPRPRGSRWQLTGSRGATAGMPITFSKRSWQSWTTEGFSNIRTEIAACIALVHYVITFTILESVKINR